MCLSYLVDHAKPRFAVLHDRLYSKLSLDGESPGLEFRGHPVERRLVEFLRLRTGDDGAAGDADVARSVDGAVVLEDLPQEPGPARRLAARVHDDRHDGTPRPLGELRADRGVALAAEDVAARPLRIDEEAVPAADALLADPEDAHQVLARRRAADRHHPHPLRRLLEKRQMGERRLGDVADRTERQQDRRQQDRLRHRHVVAEVEYGAPAGGPILKALDDHVHAEPLGGRHGTEAELRPVVRRQLAKRLRKRAARKDPRHAPGVA